MTFQDQGVAARLRAEFPGALRRGQLVGYFQPEVELATGRLAGAELLARWEHPELGTLPPALFVQLAEELGLTGEFTEMMLRRALAGHRAWAAAGWAVRVSVNIGPSCVADPGFPARVAGLLREHEVPGPMLALEVSEETRTLMANGRFFAQLAESGVRVSLDDFGTGFASLESLGGWPVNELKLDLSIVRPIAGNPAFRAIAGTAIELAHQLGVTVVAEGVESKLISSELRSLGCDAGQGFFLGRPMPAADFTDWMREQGRRVPRVKAAGHPPPGWRAPGPDPEPGGWRGRIGGAPRGAVLAVQRAAQTVGGGMLAAAVVITTAYGLWQVFRWGGRQYEELIGFLAPLPVTALAVLLAWLASRRADLDRRTRRAWRMLFLGMLVYLTGQGLQALEVGIRHNERGVTWAAMAFLSVYGFAFGCLVSFPTRRRSGRERLRLLLDMGTVFTGGAVAIWYVALGPAVEGGLRLTPASLLNFTFPIGDLLVFFGAVSVLWRGVPRASSTALRILVAGVLAFVAADITYAYLVAHSAYRSGSPVGMLWVLAITLICLALSSQLRARPDTSFPGPRPASRHPSYLPYLAVLGSCLLLLTAGLPTIKSVPLTGVLIGSVALTFLISARQYTALRDYGQLAVRYRDLAAIDGMTGLFNRRHFMEAAEAALAHAQRLDRPLIALLIDVDDFKRINDTHGHAAGDRVLIEVARACREHVRPGDIVGRYGGDEFTIVLPGVTSARAVQLADQLTRPAARPPDGGGPWPEYRISVGIAERGADDDLITLLGHADIAMYEAKRAGGGGWRIYGGTAGNGWAGGGRAAPVPPPADRRPAARQ